MVPPDFVKNSFETWMKENKFTSRRFYFDDKFGSTYIEFDAIYQLYDKNMDIIFGGNELEDLHEVFRQVNALKSEMLEELKSITSFTITSITFTSYHICIENKPQWIHCQEWIPLGCYKHIMHFGNIQLFVDLDQLDVNTAMQLSLTAVTVVHHLNGEFVKPSSSLWEITFPTYRLHLITKQKQE